MIRSWNESRSQQMEQTRQQLASRLPQRCPITCGCADRRQALPLPSLITFAELSGMDRQQGHASAQAHRIKCRGRVCHLPVHIALREPSGVQNDAAGAGA